MDELFQAIAILLFILLGGAGEIFKKIRKSTQPKDAPKTPPSKPAKPQPQMDQYGTPSPKDQKEKDDPITTVFKELFDMEPQDVVIVDEPPPPPPGERVDRPKKGNIFEDWRDQSQKEIPPFRPEAYAEISSQPKPKKQITKPKLNVAPPKIVQKKHSTPVLLAGASAASTETRFQTLYDRYGDNPLKLAVIYNEILGRPRSLRNSSPRKYT